MNLQTDGSRVSDGWPAGAARYTQYNTYHRIFEDRINRGPFSHFPVLVSQVSMNNTGRSSNK